MLKAIAKKRVRIVGPGDNLLNMVHASDVADGAILAATHPAAAGQVYNLSSTGEITQQQLLDTLCGFLGQPRVESHVPRRAAFRIAMVMEIIGWIIRLQRAPYVTRQGVSLITRPTQFSSRKARQELGWMPKVAIGDGLAQTLHWMSSHGLAATTPAVAATGR
jgi:UDP-glucose 4-epimerase